MKPIRSARCAVLLTGWLASSALAPTRPANAAGPWGEVHFAISCEASVQATFDQAVAMLHSFEFGAAAKAFTAVAHDDPTCAMAYWGLATTAMGSLFAGRTGPVALEKGWDLVQQAKTLGAKTAREQAYIAAAEAFYRDADKRDQGQRMRAYTDALEQIYIKYPDDPEAEIFYGYAVAALAPPTDKTYAYELKGAAILEKAFARNPNHPGAAHYLIHAYDHTPIAARGLAAARRYPTIAPFAPHALQIPSHIFARLGLWQDSIDANRPAAKVDNLFWKFLAMDFLLYSYLETGQDQAAKKVLDEFTAIESVDVHHVNIAYVLADMPTRYAVERRRWDEAAAISLPKTDYPWTRFPQAEAVLVFVRALGAARTADATTANKDLDRLQELHANLVKAEGDAFKDYWLTQIDVHRQMVTAWITHAEGKREEALQMLRTAADREDAIEKDPVVPATIISARELLGEMLLESNRPQQALEAFEADLRNEPSRFWSLYGAAQAAERAGDRERARSFYADLVARSVGADGDRAALKAARTFLRATKG
jgi:tetratricopeptide (TPR) repeat protein